MTASRLWFGEDSSIAYALIIGIMCMAIVVVFVVASNDVDDVANSEVVCYPALKPLNCSWAK